MTDLFKIEPTPMQPAALVYVSQAKPSQVEHNRASAARLYSLGDKACQLAWAREQVVIIDKDLGLSGTSADKPSVVSRMASEVALTHVDLILGLEVSRLAHNNADWYRLLELCGLIDTLVSDNEGLCHPARFNDRLLLGLKGAMEDLLPLYSLTDALLRRISGAAILAALPITEESHATTKLELHRSPTLVDFRLGTTGLPTKTARRRNSRTPSEQGLPIRKTRGACP